MHVHQSVHSIPSLLCMMKPLKRKQLWHYTFSADVFWNCYYSHKTNQYHIFHLREHRPKIFLSESVVMICFVAFCA